MTTRIIGQVLLAAMPCLVACEGGYTPAIHEIVDVPTLSLELTTAQRIRRATFMMEGTGERIEIMAPNAAICVELSPNGPRPEAIAVRAMSPELDKEVSLSESKPGDEIGFDELLHDVPFSVEIQIEAELEGDIDGVVLVSADVDVFFDDQAQADAVELSGSVTPLP